MDNSHHKSMILAACILHINVSWGMCAIVLALIGYSDCANVIGISIGSLCTIILFVTCICVICNCVHPIISTKIQLKGNRIFVIDTTVLMVANAVLFAIVTFSQINDVCMGVCGSNIIMWVVINSIVFAIYTCMSKKNIVTPPAQNSEVPKATTEII
jgi:hypothetical protein